ncbi:hypothetical protein NEIMUCOT_06388 [Neisseria mucosa ATCC 25996]|uniref:Uncharacterized protein n=1 Tax=Neisseria mucosa (strain ATCC 25996 / DSM 4631 / NCTC 10774 / M26) TaxID=546266 RepID=D3A0F2_NEIM2|nr:hypothetical protein NEIMUCOT_06388 [Neisseria mucosa ATCC 25996]
MSDWLENRFNFVEAALSDDLFPKNTAKSCSSFPQFRRTNNHTDTPPP